MSESPTVTMKLQLEELGFAKNIRFHAKMTRECIVCDSPKIYANQFGILCRCCGSLWSFE